MLCEQLLEKKTGNNSTFDELRMGALIFQEGFLTAWIVFEARAATGFTEGEQ